ncbi:hypothetical protein BDV27DRAFT_122404 [Aspergillus caelatus]|uniref:Uncharacterized protein n=1 Tax=Aspergillus caelatus TaxID=61420 RepID=A0A5N7AGQ1_9EURO|nr:uncharacterized protein BDV27DRAFT_122404 [Aspergillus caelatus]KAE8368346.1 hypothetical protein BDV27DRAFT_122404 [Aspergillus caelatus]
MYLWSTVPSSYILQKCNCKCLQCQSDITQQAQHFRNIYSIDGKARLYRALYVIAALFHCVVTLHVER